MADTVKGPFFVNDLGDWVYVVSASGVRMAEADDNDAKSKAEQICAALNTVHYLSEAMGGNSGGSNG